MGIGRQKVPGGRNRVGTTYGGMGSLVTTQKTSSAVFVGHETAPRAARQMARRLMSPADADTLELLVSELVTNAILHAGGDVGLTISDLGDCIRVEVSDSSARLPIIEYPTMDFPDIDTRGRGLVLVAALANRWGSERTVTGKTVWCEVSSQGDDSVTAAPAPTL
jgi:anti-sigma regulatory factor (Ser/Thr protein kinase)